MVRRHYLVSGRVQGVGFRAFVHRQARSRELAGAVRNLADGRVEIVAMGDEESIAQFEVDVRRGPAASRVADFERRELQVGAGAENFSRDEFSIVADGETTWKF